MRHCTKTHSDQHAVMQHLQFHRSKEQLPPNLWPNLSYLQSAIPAVYQLLSFCHASVMLGNGVQLFSLPSSSHRCTDNGSHFLLASIMTHSLYLLCTDILPPWSPSVPPPVQLCMPVLLLIRLRSISVLLMYPSDLNAPQHLSAFLSS